MGKLANKESLDDENSMITMKLQGGLGNQLFQYALGRNLAIKNSTDLVLKSSYIGEFTHAVRKYELSNFNIVGQEEKDNDTDRDVGTKSNIINERSFSFDPNILNTTSPAYLDGFWQSEKYFRDIEDTIRNEITLKGPLDKKFKKMKNEISSSNSLSIHVRRSDYLLPKHKEVYASCSIEYYKKSVEEVARKSNPLTLKIFVFSDDPKWAMENLSPLFPFTLVSTGDFSICEELILMSCCKHNIIANSTFSWWGAWLNENPNKVVITPERWFIDTNKKEDDLIPSTWIKLTKKPKVTVLMPVFNGQSYIDDAIKSILDQSFEDFEFLIIDDGSSDKSAEIIRSYTDKRIIYISNGINRGLPYTLNRGLDIAQGEYIARMDCDDISLPERLKKEVEFMEKNPDITVCGTWIKTIGNNSGFINKYFTEDSDIKASLLFNTSLAHPSVMIRNSDLKRLALRYNTNYKYFEEDYSLWVKLSKKTKLANIPEVLLLYRLHKKSVSQINISNRKEGVSLIRQKQLESLGLNPNQEDIYIHNSLRPTKGETATEFVTKEELWLMKIIEINKRTNIYNKGSLSKIIYIRWKTICGTNSQGGLKIWRIFTHSQLYLNYGKNKILDSLKLLIKLFLA